MKRQNKDRNQTIPLLTTINLVLGIFFYLTKAETNAVLNGEYGLFLREMVGFTKNIMYFEHTNSGFTESSDRKLRIGFGIVTVVIAAILVLGGFYVLKMKDCSAFYIISPITNIVNLFLILFLGKQDMLMFISYGGLDLSDVTGTSSGFTFAGWIFLILSIIQIIEILRARAIQPKQETSKTSVEVSAESEKTSIVSLAKDTEPDASEKKKGVDLTKNS